MHELFIFFHIKTNCHYLILVFSETHKPNQLKIEFKQFFKNNEFHLNSAMM